VVPLIPKFLIKWRVAFITQPVHLGEKASGNRCPVGWIGSNPVLTLKKGRIICPYWKSDSDFSIVQPVTYSTYRLSYYSGLSVARKVLGMITDFKSLFNGLV
jgi:hypothetical protein